MNAHKRAQRGAGQSGRGLARMRRRVAGASGSFCAGCSKQTRWRRRPNRRAGASKKSSESPRPGETRWLKYADISSKKGSPRNGGRNPVISRPFRRDWVRQICIVSRIIMSPPRQPPKNPEISPPSVSNITSDNISYVALQLVDVIRTPLF